MIYLTTHENIDIAIDAMIFFSDLIDLELDEENSDGLMSLYDELVNISINQIIYLKNREKTNFWRKLFKICKG